MKQISKGIVEHVKPAYLWWAIVAMGILLRVRQYFSGRSFWGDEAAVAVNLVQRNFVGLTQPLAYKQGAPVGFLFVEKSLILLFGNRDQVMRLFPLLSGILAVYLFYRVAQTQIKSGMFATLLFAINWSLIVYSSELKQYSTDVMVALLLAWLAGRCLKGDVQPRDVWMLGIAGMAAIWFSHPSVFILAGNGLALFVAAITRSQPIPVKWLFGLAAMWAVTFSLDYLVSLRHLAADNYLHAYWRNAFMPLPHHGTIPWLWKTFYSFLQIAFNRTDQILVVLVLILVPIGCISLLYRDWGIAIMMISPFFIALLASLAQLYPMKGRMILYLVPFLFFLIAEGLGYIYSLVAKRHTGIARIVHALPALVFILLAADFTGQYLITPYVSSNIKPVIQYVADHHQEDDSIYVYHTSNSTFEYYAPFYGLEHADVLLGRSQRTKRVSLRQFYADVNKLKGKSRVWFIFSRIEDCGDCEGDKQLFYVNYLNTQGALLDSFQGAGANVFLYDLKQQ